MRIIKAKDYDAMSRAAATSSLLRSMLKPNCVLGLATGSSPIGTYKQLIEWNKAGDLDFSAVRSVNLDEYAGLTPDHDQSYAYFMRHNLFDHVNIDLANTNVPSGVNGDGECERYDKLIPDFGGIDLQLLGLGVNGHIGFNERRRPLLPGTHQVTLTESTRRCQQALLRLHRRGSHPRLHHGCAGHHAGSAVLMVASGANKAQAIKDAFFAPLTPPSPPPPPPTQPTSLPGRGSPVSHLIFFIPFQKGQPIGLLPFVTSTL